MKKYSFFIVWAILSIQLGVAQQSLQGFVYAKTDAPSGNEWESPENLSLNKLQPRAWFFSFQDVESARKVLPENSKYWQSLNGNWKFNWAPDPNSRPKDFYKVDYNVDDWDEIPVPSNWNIYGIQKDGTLKYGVPIYCNQPVIFQHTIAVDDWKGGVMRIPPTDWVTYKHRNEIGSHRRDFTIPEDWDGREIFISFDGVDSFFYLWINGQYIGFSKNSRNTARFDITDYVNKGVNTVAVEVYRSSDGSFLEAQDMFRLPGIFRTVAIYSTPKVHIEDIVVTPDLDNYYINGALDVDVRVANLGTKKAEDYKLEYSLYANELYSDANVKIDEIRVSDSTFELIKSGSRSSIKTRIELDKPNLWSAEMPYRYTLVAELKDKKNRTVETVSVYTGFRKVEIKDTPASDDEFGLAGRYFYVNGMPVKLKGVNRHESNPATGHVLTRKEMEEEVMLMKRANINHVRNSHYPPDPYWFYLSDKYGLYLEDESNLESHQYYYGKESLSHPKEWEAAHVARVMEMAHSTVNAPSIVIWSLGNEGGPGKNFVAAYNALKAFDKSRPVQYERNNNIVDMGSNQYPSIAWMREAVKGTYNIKYPFHVSEYAHSMGNACGNLVDYWDAIESTNFFCGGAIWDWIDQAMYNYDNGTRYLAYGGDFGDKPNSGQFVMNGLIFADMKPKPQYYEVKKVYQHIGVKMLDAQKGEFEVFNKYYFQDLSDYEVLWSLYKDGKSVESHTINIGDVPARERINVNLGYNFSAFESDAEYMVKIQFALNSNQPWADKKFVQAEEQFLLKSADRRPLISDITSGSLQLDARNKDMLIISGSDFKLDFDMQEGTIFSLVYGNEELISAGNGPRLDALRAFTNNDNWFYTHWFTNGLHNLKHKVLTSNVINRGNSIMLVMTVESQAPNGAVIHGGTDSGRNTIEELIDKPFDDKDFKFTTNQIWTVYADGSIELKASVLSNKPSVVLPRLGYIMKIPAKYENFTYYGRGPADNYPDRKVGQFIEQYKSTVAKEFVDFPKPQEMSNHEDVRWCALTSGANSGIAVIGDGSLSVSALGYSSMDMIKASHPYKLPAVGDTYLRIDAATTGLGGNSCGQGGPLVEDRVFAGNNSICFIIRPVNNNLDEVVDVVASEIAPISMVRNSLGVVKILSDMKDEEILYKIGKSRTMTYTAGQVIELRDGGTVVAWYKSNPKIRTTMSFSKIDRTQVVVVNASSEEVGEGSASNLVDGDANTFWHTMYSVTVAKHPHWVELDAGNVKEIKGFVYLPRAGGGNGTVKDYSVSVSVDGKEWGEPVAVGTFPSGDNEQRVLFNSSVKARYIRFTALSEQNGQDFASGAELTILTE